MSILLISGALKQPVSDGGGGGATPFTFQNSSNITAEADGGYLQTNNGTNAYATTVQRINPLATNRLGTVLTSVGSGNQVVNLVPVSSLPFTSRTAQHFFYKSGTGIDVYIDGAYITTPTGTIADEYAWSFDGSGRITVKKNGSVVYTDSVVRSTEDYALQLWVDSGSPVGTGYVSGSKT